jgi:REP element-mobilizing transposase RayT
MPQSLSNILLHIVFSTKNRVDSISEEIEAELYAYIASICKSYKCDLIKIGGTSNHIHILCTLARTVSVSTLIEKLKSGSSKWIKTKAEELELFSWQSGYGVFSIGQSQIPFVEKYIINQKSHHSKISFMDEFREFLHKYQIEYDERYVWD